MTVIETNDDLVVVDCGLMFPDEEMFGVDVVINDFTYVRERAHKLRGVLVTHGHEDHIGGIPYFLREFPDTPVAGTPMTVALIKAKSREHKMGEIELHAGQAGRPCVVTARSTPSSCTSITRWRAPARWRSARRSARSSTPATSSSTKRRSTASPPTSRASRASATSGVLCMLSDSTNAERPGHTLSERIVGEAFTAIFARAKGRIVIASFASNVPRIQQAVDHAERFGRKVAFLGRSMQNVVHFSSELGHLRIPPGTTIKIEDVDSYPPEQVVVMTTGSQGEPMSGLARMSVRDHKKFRIVPGDTIVISATPIPGQREERL